MASVFDYIFRIGGNFVAQISGMSAAAGEFSANIETAQGKMGGFVTMLARFDLIKNYYCPLNYKKSRGCVKMAQPLFHNLL